MLNLEIFEEKVITDFYKLLGDDFIGHISNKVQSSKLKYSIKNYLTNSLIKEILFSRPDRLYEIHLDFIQIIDKTCTEIDYDEYLTVRVKKIKSKTDKILISKYNQTIKNLSSIFDYEYYISSKKKRSYGLSKIIGKNTCTYCNRLYTFTIIQQDKKTKRVNNSTRIARPQFDHWFPKKKYPLFALSFYNLIPSCSVCNSSVKGDESFKLSTHLHPYIKEPNEKFVFSYKFDASNNPMVILKTTGAKAEQTAKDLKISEVYEEHSQYELKELIDLRFKYSENYLDILFNKSFDLKSVSKNDIYRMVFGVEIDPNNFHKRPLSKFKNDILRELKVIK